MKLRKIFGLIMAGTLMVSTMCSCGTNNAGQAEVDDTPIKIAVYPLPSPYFEYAMEELGEFEEHGANVELVQFAQYTDVIQALDSGNVDGAIMGITESVSPIVNDLGLEIIAMTDYSYGMDGLVVSADITDLSMLEGETIATNIGTMNHMLLLNALSTVGLSADDVNVTNMSEGDATAAFVGGSIKAASIFDPQMTKAAEEGNGTIIYSSKDMKGQLADVLLMSDEIIESKPEQVQGIVDAWFCTQAKFAGEDKDAIVSAIATKAELSNDEFLDLLNGIEFASVEYNQEVYANDGAKMKELVTNVATFLYETECVESMPTDEQIAAAINGEFIENVSVGE